MHKFKNLFQMKTTKKVETAKTKKNENAKGGAKKSPKKDSKKGAEEEVDAPLAISLKIADALKEELRSAKTTKDVSDIVFGAMAFCNGLINVGKADQSDMLDTLSDMTRIAFEYLQPENDA